MSIMSNIGKIGIPTAFAAMDYNYAKSEGKSNTRALMSAAGEFAMGEIFGMGYLGIMAAQAMPSMISGGISAMAQQQRVMGQNSINKPFSGATFVDTKQAYTMRQAAMGAISRDRMVRQQMLMGQEAKYIGR